jgi:hypothetical protein
VRRCIAAIATAGRTDPEDLLTRALRSEKVEAVKLGREVESANAQVERKRNERLAPPVKTMENVARYVAHLSRELYKALHEREAMQARRRGEAAPLVPLSRALLWAAGGGALRGEPVLPLPPLLSIDLCHLQHGDRRSPPGEGPKIRERLGGSASLMAPFPAKPKGMHDRTYLSSARRKA